MFPIFRVKFSLKLSLFLYFSLKLSTISVFVVKPDNSENDNDCTKSKNEIDDYQGDDLIFNTKKVDDIDHN